MKALTLIGILSLAANATLLGVLVFGSAQRSAAPNSEPVNVAAPTVRAPKAPAAPVTWPEVSSVDLAVSRDRLQAEGFPPSAIRRILAAQIHEKFAARRKGIENSAAAQPFWKSAGLDPATQTQLRAIAKEEQAELKTLLGPDPENSAATKLRQQFPDFSPDKVDQLVAIRERYDEMRQDIYGGARGAITPSEREKAAALEKAMHNEFAAILTPAELENYDLRSGNTANNLRYNLRTFEPNEAEFRALFRLQSAFNDQHAYTGPSSQEQMRARSEAQRQLNEQIAAALGPERYKDYQRSNDYHFQQTSQLVSRLGMPAETANSLYAVQKEFEERRTRSYSGPTAQADMIAHMTTLQQEATARVSTVLGGNRTAVDAYKQYGGSWLAQMVPRPPPQPKK